MKTLLRSMLGGVLAAGVLFGSAGGVMMRKASADTAAPAEEKTIAMYLIAGQSNAAGYSLVDQVNDGYKTEHAEGFPNVHYYGRADGRNFTDFNTTVTFGQGQTTSHFGSEIGIADKHTETYPSQEAIIVKYAQGATYLVDTVNGITSQYGNWCPPSMTRSQAGLSGKLYDGFIQTVKAAVDHYAEAGYTVELKGTFWMQGEAETDGSYAKDQGDYEAHLKALIGDLREDYAEILEDESAKNSPFIIGKICPTFNRGVNGNVEEVRKIQEAVAQELDEVYLVETEQYPIVDPATGEPRGPDLYHFEGNDMVSLGRDVGDTFIAANTAHVRVIVNGNGKAEAASLQGEYVFLDTAESKTVTFTATKAHYIIKSAVYDGADVLPQFEDGAFTITDTRGAHRLTVTFGEETKYKISVEADEEMTTVVRDPISRGYYAGETVSVKIAANEGYKITAVKYNGEALTLTDGEATVTVSAGENILRVEAAANGQEPGDTEEPGKSASNKRNVIIGASVAAGGAAIGLALLGLFIGLKKRKGH